MWDSTEEQDEEDTKKTAYMWDSMEDEDRKAADFHQLLHIHQDIQDE